MAKRRARRGSGTVWYSAHERRWIADYTADGVKHRRRARDEDSARLRLDELVREYGPGRPSRNTLADWLAEWLTAHGRSIRPSTLTSYRGHVRLYIEPLLGRIRLSDLAPRDVRRLIGDLEAKGRSAATIQLVIRTLSTALNAAVADRLIRDNPASRVPLPRIEREPVRALTAADADAILDAVAGTWIERPVRVWLGSGLRRGELLGLDQRDLALERGFVVVRRSKTSVRAVPVSDDAVQALREALAAAPRRGPAEPVFFAPRSGDRMRGDSITHALGVRLEAAGLGHLTPHALRHGVASLMLAEGHQMRVIAEQLGHRNPSLTAAVYAHVVPSAQRAAVDALERRRTK